MIRKLEGCLRQEATRLIRETTTFLCPKNNQLVPPPQILFLEDIHDDSSLGHQVSPKIITGEHRLGIRTLQG